MRARPPLQRFLDKFAALAHRRVGSACSRAIRRIVGACTHSAANCTSSMPVATRCERGHASHGATVADSPMQIIAYPAGRPTSQPRGRPRCTCRAITLIRKIGQENQLAMRARLTASLLLAPTASILCKVCAIAHSSTFPHGIGRCEYLPNMNGGNCQQEKQQKEKKTREIQYFFP